MNEANSPFVLKTVKCPACGTSRDQRFFRLRLFVPEDKESDGHVQTYQWISDATRPVHPPYYYLFYCPQCHFADTTDDYANPSRAEHNVYVVKAYRGLGDKERDSVGMLGSAIAYDDLDFSSALNLHFLAVLAQTFPEKFAWDPYKLARLFLRIAWLYREQAPEAGGGRKAASVDQMMAALVPMSSALHEVQTAWDRAALGALQRAEEVKAELGARENPYVAAHADVQAAIEKLIGALHRLKTVAKHDADGTLAGQDNASARYFAYSSREDFLAKLKMACPILPLDEREALRSAIRYLNQALAEDVRLDNPKAHFATVTLIADLHLRCDDIEAAFGLVRSMYKSASDARVKYQKELAENKHTLDEEGRQRLVNRIRRANTSLGEAAELRQKLLSLLLARDRQKLLSIVNSNPDASPEELETILKDNGVIPGLLAYIKEKGGIQAALH